MTILFLLARLSFSHTYLLLLKLAVCFEKLFYRMFSVILQRKTNVALKSRVMLPLLSVVCGLYPKVLVCLQVPSKINWFFFYVMH